LPAMLDGYEQRVIELRPASTHAMGVEGVRYSVGASTPQAEHFTVFGASGAAASVSLPDAKAIQSLEIDGKEIPADTLASDGTFLVQFGGESRKGPSFSQPSIQVTHADEKGEDAEALLTVDIPRDSQAATFGFLLQSAQPSNDVGAELRVNAKAVVLATRKSSQGLWSWFGTELGPGSYALDFRFHLPAGRRAGSGFSGWLRLRRKLVAREVVVKLKAGQDADAQPADPLPAPSAIDRRTYRVFDETL